MKYRKMGKTGPTISTIGLGCMGMSEFYGVSNREEAITTLLKAMELGVTHFDTADMYGKGENEILLGEAIKKAITNKLVTRDQLVIATKCGIKRTETGIELDSTPEYIKAACDASLARLGIATIDIFYLHRHNKNVPIETAMKAMQELINAGKIKYVGLSETDAVTVKKAYSILGEKLIVVQTEYSVTVRGPAAAILPTCIELGLAFVAYSPIARGLLTGSIKNFNKFSQIDSKTNPAAYDFRSDLPFFKPENQEKNLKFVDAFSTIAKEQHCTPVQLALAWLLAQGTNIFAIPGTRRLTHLAENLAAADIVLEKKILEKINKVLLENPIVGARLPANLMEMFELKV